MMKRTLAAIALSIIIVVSIFTGMLLARHDQTIVAGKPDVLIGITYCGNTVENGKHLIDKVKDYTNLFILGSGLLQRDYNSVEELGDYAVGAGMYFLPYFGNFVPSTFQTWLDSAKQRWGDHLLGVYYSDEAGGKMLDDNVRFIDSATGDEITKTRYCDVAVQKANGIVINYQINGMIQLFEPAAANDTSDVNSEADFYPNGTVQIIKPAANGFSYQTYQQLQDIRPFKTVDETAQRFIARDKDNIDFIKNSAVKVFTSDYALFWFDYKSGYDVVLGQLGWNLSVTQQIALLRGAATVQNKDWGVIITWQTQTAPYLASGPEILSQMKTAYQCGSKYFVVFDYYDSDNSTYGSMKEEHFQALLSFWNYAVSSPAETNSIRADSVLVLPQNYGWGMRWNEDIIWGIFLPDQKTSDMWTLKQDLLEKNGLKLDIVYEDSNFTLPNYQNICYWNASNNGG